MMRRDDEMTMKVLAYFFSGRQKPALYFTIKLKRCDLMERKTEKEMSSLKLMRMSVKGENEDTYYVLFVHCGFCVV